MTETQLSERQSPEAREAGRGNGGARGPTFIIYSQFPNYSGGRENWLYNVLCRLDELGYGCTVYSCASDRPPFHELAPLKGLRLVRVPSLRHRERLFGALRRVTLDMALWLDAFKFARGTYRDLEKRWRGERIVAMNPIVELQPALRLKRRRPEVWVGGCVRERAAWGLSRLSPWARPYFRSLEKRSLTAADAVLANGYDTRDELRARGIASTVIPNGVDWERFAKARQGGPEPGALTDVKQAGQAMIMMVGTLWWGKGVDSLLQAGKLMLSEGRREFQVVFVGKGRQDRYRQEVGKQGLEGHVFFAGEQKDVPSLLRLADVSVNLSGGLGMSMAALESMAAGKAIVAWDSPVYRQLIEHDRTGVLVEEGNAEALARELARLLDEPDRREALGRAAQDEARKYDWRLVAERLLEVVNVP